MFNNIKSFVAFLALIFATQALAAENPDELYRQGLFAEAAEAYSRSDMDNPKDIRYRYNRGCAAYQNSDYQGAMASFSSVARRAQDNEMRFKSIYNLGNAAFKQGDFASAVAHYKQAIAYNPESEDARHNLELALRELEKQKKEETQQPDTRPQKDSGQPEEKGDQQQSGRKGEDSDGKQSEEKPAEQSPPQAQEQRDEKGQTQSGQSPKDLSGDLKPLQAMPEEKEEDESLAPDLSTIDKKKAEALLDNIKEDRSRFLRFQVPEDKRHGVQSGKDW